MAEWKGEFGQQYTKRNALSLEEYEKAFEKQFGFTRTELNQRSLESVPKSSRILEVGCNIGNQLLCLQKMGFTNLCGLEVQWGAAQTLKQKAPAISVVQSTAFHLPFENESFDLVFTSGVLIHISPADLGTVMSEIHRCSKTYIWGFEYWAEQWTKIPYRGHGDLLWKGDYGKKYLDSFSDLALVKQEKLKYLDQPLTDVMFLLKKKS